MSATSYTQPDLSVSVSKRVFVFVAVTCTSASYTAMSQPTQVINEAVRLLTPNAATELPSARTFRPIDIQKVKHSRKRPGLVPPQMSNIVDAVLWS